MGGSYHYLQLPRGGCRKDGARLSSDVLDDRTRSNEHNYGQGEFSLGNRKKKIFTMMTVKRWKGLPKESLSLERGRTGVGTALSNVA